MNTAMLPFWWGKLLLNSSVKVFRRSGIATLCSLATPRLTRRGVCALQELTRKRAVFQKVGDQMFAQTIFESLVAIGPTAAVFAIQYLNDLTGTEREELLVQIGVPSVRVLAQGPTGCGESQRLASRVLARIGDPAADELIRLLKEQASWGIRDIRESSVGLLLLQIGPSAIPALTGVLRDGGKAKRYAAQLLATIGGEPVIGPLGDYLAASGVIPRPQRERDTVSQLAADLQAGGEARDRALRSIADGILSKADRPSKSLTKTTSIADARRLLSETCSRDPKVKQEACSALRELASTPGSPFQSRTLAALVSSPEGKFARIDELLSVLPVVAKLRSDGAKALTDDELSAIWRARHLGDEHGGVVNLVLDERDRREGIHIVR